MKSPRFRSASALGNLGEAILTQWANGVGYVANPSGDDRAGWDMIIESPPEAAAHLSDGFEHEDTFPFRVRIQVKATDARKGRIRKVALSTWLRLAEAREPAFFLVLEMGGHEAPQAAYLVHVGEEDIRDVLRQRREAQVRGDVKLHKIHRDVVYRDAPRVAPPSGEGLLDTIDATVAAIGPDYTAWKHALRTTAGYEEGRGVAELTFPPGFPAAVEIAELAVGLRNEVPFQRADLYPIRFGLRSNTPALILQGGTVVGAPPRAADKAEIVLSAPSLGLQATARAELFLSPPVVIPTPPKDDVPNGDSFSGGVPLRMRVRGLHVSVLFRAEHERFEVSFQPPGPNERVALRGLREMVDFAAVGVAARDAESPVEIALHTDRGGSIQSGLAMGIVRDIASDSLPTIHALLDGLWRIAQAHNVEDRILASLQEIVDQGQIIAVLDGAAQRTLEGTVEMQTSYGSVDALAHEDPAGLPFAYVSGLSFADWHLVSVVQFGRVVVEQAGALKRTLRIPIDAPRILHRHTRRPGEPAPDFFDLGRAAARAARERILFAEQPRVHIIAPDA